MEIVCSTAQMKLKEKKTLVENTWKLKASELESKLKESELKFQKEHNQHQVELQRVHSTAKNNIDKLRDRLDELVEEMKVISVQQDRDQHGTSTLVEENSYLKRYNSTTEKTS